MADSTQGGGIGGAVRSAVDWGKRAWASSYRIGSAADRADAQRSVQRADANDARISSAVRGGAQRVKARLRGKRRSGTR